MKHSGGHFVDLTKYVEMSGIECNNKKKSVKTETCHNAIFLSLMTIWNVDVSGAYRLVSQMQAPLAACREPAGKLWQLCKVLYVSEHKTKYLLIHVPFTRIVVFRHIGYVPPMISYNEIGWNTTTVFFIAAIFVQFCYTTGSRFL